MRLSAAELQCGSIKELNTLKEKALKSYERNIRQIDIEIRNLRLERGQITREEYDELRKISGS